MPDIRPRKPFKDHSGRQITEWFEKPADPPKSPRKKLSPTANGKSITAEDTLRWEREGRVKGNPGRTKFKGFHTSAMSRQEIQCRLNEASIMISPENQKSLPTDIQQRTGLEMNPLWLMECLIRSGTLSPDKSVAALKTLAEYTHSKAPSLNQTLLGISKAEDFLLNLVEEEYPQVEVETVAKAPNGQGKNHDKEVQRYQEQQKAEWAALYKGETPSGSRRKTPARGAD